VSPSKCLSSQNLRRFGKICKIWVFAVETKTRSYWVRVNYKYNDLYNNLRHTGKRPYKDGGRNLLYLP
jgi:hypothetical protein